IAPRNTQTELAIALWEKLFGLLIGYFRKISAKNYTESCKNVRRRVIRLIHQLSTSCTQS
ncbi:hypothetical protein, partial [Nostoc sp. UCD120]|uniref:hypothetical protein n=1 Tax=Nostoc sp. UCD120 TaxID=2681312 RepID=UPI001C892C3F